MPTNRTRVHHFDARYVGISYNFLHTVGLRGVGRLRDTSLIACASGARPSLFTGTREDQGAHLWAGRSYVLLLPKDPGFDEICSRHGLSNDRPRWTPLPELWKSPENRDITDRLSRAVQQSPASYNRVDAREEAGKRGIKALQGQVGAEIKIEIPDRPSAQALHVFQAMKGTFLPGWIEKIEEISTEFDRQKSSSLSVEDTKKRDESRRLLDEDHARATAIYSEKEAPPSGSSPAVMTSHIEAAYRREESAGPTAKVESG